MVEYDTAMKSIRRLYVLVCDLFSVKKKSYVPICIEKGCYTHTYICMYTDYSWKMGSWEERALRPSGLFSLTLFSLCPCQGDTSGDFMKALLAICGGED